MDTAAPALPWRAASPALARARTVAVAVAVGLPLALAVGVAWWRAPTVAAALVTAAAVAVLALLLRAVRRNARSWAYCEGEEDLLVRSGVLVRRVVAVPYGRMQLVDVITGPLGRRFGFATVQLHTAAASTKAHIAGVPAADADELRVRLTARGEARAPGL